MTARPTVAAPAPLEEKLAGLRNTLVATEKGLAASRERVTAAAGALERNAQRETQVALGECTAEEVAAERKPLLVEQHEAQEESRRLQAALAGLPARIAKVEATLELRAHGRLDDALGDAFAERDSAAERVAAALTPALAAFRGLSVARSRVDSAFGKLRESSASLGAQAPEFQDEHDWRPEGFEVLVAGLLEGHRTPAAAARRSSEIAAERLREADRAWIKGVATKAADGYITIDQAIAEVGAEHEDALVARFREIRRERLETIAAINALGRASQLEDASPDEAERIRRQAAEDAVEHEKALAQIDAPLGEVAAAEANGAGERDVLAEVARANAGLLP